MLANDVSKAVFEGNGMATHFPFTFKVWEEAQLTLEVTDAQNTTAQVYDFTVDLTEEGGTVHYMHKEKPLPTGYKLSILRNMPFLQEVDLISGTRFDPAVIEDALDKATAERQQLKEAVSRSMKLDASSPYTPETLVQELRENTALSMTSASNAATSEAHALASAEASATSATAAQKSAHDAAKSAAEAGYAAGEEAVARVTAEGDSQVARVQTEGNSILSSMADLARTAFIPGMVVAFSGSFGGPDNAHPIPKGQTEPDMTWKLHEPSRGKFILGGTGQNQGALGGDTSTLPFTLTANEMPNHTHGTAPHSHSMSMLLGKNYVGSSQNIARDERSAQWEGGYGSIGSATVPINATGGNQAHSHGQNLPPYYTLAYIEKLPISGGSSGNTYVTRDELTENLETYALKSELPDVSGFASTEQINALAQSTNQALAGKQGILTAGDNITITEDGVISSTGGGSSGPGGVDYKTIEQDTGLKALDGSPVYQITISLPTWDGTAAVAHGIVGLTNIYTAKAVVAQGV